MNRYFKHFILCGDIDQYCLLCKKTFQRIPDIESHIKSEPHTVLEKDLAYIKKFETEFIYKISGKYYCELCNRVTPHMTSLKEHIKSMRHLLLKEKPEAVIKKPSGLYVAGEVVIDRKVLLNKFEWNTIGDKVCLLCDIPISNIDDHIDSEDHMISLIQSEITYGDNRYYRKLQEDAYHCFTCKKIFTAITLEEHWPTCVNTDEKMINKFKNSTDHEQFEAFLDDIRMVQKEHEVLAKFEEWYILDHANSIAVCKTCYTPVSMADIKFKSMIEHLKYHVLNMLPLGFKYDVSTSTAQPSTSTLEGSAKKEKIFVDYGKKRKECAEFGRTQNIAMNYNGTKGYCKYCDRHLSANLTTFKEHCQGLIHSGHREMLGQIETKDRPPVEYRSQCIKDYLCRMAYAPFKLTVYINNDFYLNFFSLFLLKRIERNPDVLRTKCFACSGFIKHGSERIHCYTANHKEVFMDAKVLCKPGEFIREIRPNLFHCAYCNIAIPYTNTLERHIRSKMHKRSKITRLPEANVAQHCRDFDTQKLKELGDDTDDTLYRQLIGYFFEDYSRCTGLLTLTPGTSSSPPKVV